MMACAPQAMADARAAALAAAPPLAQLEARLDVAFHVEEGGALCGLRDHLRLRKSIWAELPPQPLRPGCAYVAACSVRRRASETTAPSAAAKEATRTAVRQLPASTIPPAAAAPSATPPTSAVSGQVSASVIDPGGATLPASSLRVAISGAMNTPAGITSTAIVA